MSEMEIKKNSHVEDLRPLLSLNPKMHENTNRVKNDSAEQEALWNRSLEFFEHMNGQAVK